MQWWKKILLLFSFYKKGVPNVLLPKLHMDDIPKIISLMYIQKLQICSKNDISNFYLQKLYIDNIPKII